MLVHKIYTPKPGNTDSPDHIIVKAISWRITGTKDISLISRFFTGALGIVISIGSIEVFSNFFSTAVMSRFGTL